MSMFGRESVRCGLPPKLFQQSLSSTTWYLPFFFFGGLIGAVPLVATEAETPFSSVSSFPFGRSRDLMNTATAARGTSSTTTKAMRRIRRRTRAELVCQRRLMLQLGRRPIAPAVPERGLDHGRAGPGEARVGQREQGPRGDGDDAPDDRVLEEACVEQRVDEERQEHGCGAEAQRAAPLREEEEQSSRAGEQRHVDEQADDSELRGDGERRRVRAVALRGQMRLRLLPAGLRLSADSDADERVVL